MAHMQVYEAGLYWRYHSMDYKWGSPEKTVKSILGDSEGLIYKEGLTVQCVFANTETRSLWKI